MDSIIVILEVFLVIFSCYLSGTDGMLITLLFAGGKNLYTYYFSDMMLYIHYCTESVSMVEYPRLYWNVERLAQKVFITMSVVYIIREHTQRLTQLNKVTNMRRLRLVKKLMVGQIDRALVLEARKGWRFMDAMDKRRG